ncbi:MAG TPA: glycosyltransferase family 4 protein [Bacteroidales bacterium]|nr:glycosyltransferase family 4 protein [Bacteroidales bacterium]
MIYVVSLLILLVAELGYFKLAEKLNIIDKPNLRSSHSDVTLRGGGIVFFFGVLLYFFLFQFQYPYFFAGLTLITIISFMDDLKPRPSWMRLCFHFVAMGLMFYEWGLFGLPWFYTLISLVFCTGVLNAFNFMDGINGITGGYSLVVIGALWYINAYVSPFVDSDFLDMILIALMVFNFFNFRKKAKCFAGDVGAVSMAFIVVFLLGLLIIKTGDFSYILLLALYGVDSILTIVHRLMLKENIFKAHRKHLYQIMANELKMPHVVVSAIYMTLQALISVGLIISTSHVVYALGIILLFSLGYALFIKKYFRLHSL